MTGRFRFPKVKGRTGDEDGTGIGMEMGMGRINVQGYRRQADFLTPRRICKFATSPASKDMKDMKDTR